MRLVFAVALTALLAACSDAATTNGEDNALGAQPQTAVATVGWDCARDQVRSMEPEMTPSSTLQEIVHALPGSETTHVIHRGNGTGTLLIHRAEWLTANALVYRASPHKWFISELRICHR
jgi:hypothetical protein